jgi:hypothetical protein
MRIRYRGRISTVPTDAIQDGRKIAEAILAKFEQTRSRRVATFVPSYAPVTNERRSPGPVIPHNDGGKGAREGAVATTALVGNLNPDTLAGTDVTTIKGKIAKRFPPMMLALSGIVTVLWNVGWIWLMLRLI